MWPMSKESKEYGRWMQEEAENDRQKARNAALEQAQTYLAAIREHADATIDLANKLSAGLHELTR